MAHRSFTAIQIQRDGSHTQHWCSWFDIEGLSILALVGPSQSGCVLKVPPLVIFPRRYLHTRASTYYPACVISLEHRYSRMASYCREVTGSQLGLKGGPRLSIPSP